MRAPFTALVCATALWLPAALALDTGDAAPALKGVTLDGKPFDLAALKGHVVVVNLWATWCGPCREEMPLLDAFAKKHAAEGVVLVGLDEDEKADTDKVKNAMTGFFYHALMADSATENGFRAPRVLPVTYVIDAKGTVRAKLWAGGTAVTEASLEKAIAPLLATP
jgi:cytochrome c biogenesis protein CcmG/thiol:disulfide interchange protein DsbE